MDKSQIVIVLPSLCTIYVLPTLLVSEPTFEYTHRELFKQMLLEIIVSGPSLAVMSDSGLHYQRYTLGFNIELGLVKHPRFIYEILSLGE